MASSSMLTKKLFAVFVLAMGATSTAASKGPKDSGMRDASMQNARDRKSMRRPQVQPAGPFPNIQPDEDGVYEKSQEAADQCIEYYMHRLLNVDHVSAPNPLLFFSSFSPFPKNLQTPSATEKEKKTRRKSTRKLPPPAAGNPNGTPLYVSPPCPQCPEANTDAKEEEEKIHMGRSGRVLNRKIPGLALLFRNAGCRPPLLLKLL